MDKKYSSLSASAQIELQEKLEEAQAEIERLKKYIGRFTATEEIKKAEQEASEIQERMGGIFKKHAAAMGPGKVEYVPDDYIGLGSRGHSNMREGLQNQHPHVYWQQRAEELQREVYKLKESKLANKITDGIRFYAGLFFVLSVAAVALYVSLRAYNLMAICN